jgi:2-dehydropantoate 2-reductase
MAGAPADPGVKAPAVKPPTPRPLKICVVGAGSVGGVIAGLLHRAGVAVSVVARGPHLQAIRERGLEVRTEGAVIKADLPASDDPRELGPQDALIVTVKAHSLPALVPQLAPLRAPDTLINSAQNGIPWWYFHGAGGPFDGQPFETVDPGGVIWRGIGPQNAIGCVINLAADVPEPGVVHHTAFKRLTLGLPAGGDPTALESFAATLASAGIEAPITRDIRKAVWIKLQNNLSSGPLSVLTGGTVNDMRGDAGTRAVMTELMQEGRRVAAAMGIMLEDDTDKRLSGPAPAGAHKTSMLQDFEAGRPLELAAIGYAVEELGRRVGVSTPITSAILSTTRLRAQLAGCPST